jgi:hypothetical protein
MNGRMRAKKEIIWGLACFAVLQLGLSLVLAWGPWCFLIDSYYGYKAYMLKKRLAGPEKPFTVMLLGSSRTFWGMDPATLEQPLTEAVGRPVVVFNFAQNAAGPVNHYLFLHRLLKEKMRPDLLLLEIHPLLFAGQTYHCDLTEARLPASVLWRDEVSLVQDYVGDVRKGLVWDWVDSWLVPACGHRMGLITYFAPWLLPHFNRNPTFAQMNDCGFMVRIVEKDTRTDEQRRFGVEQAKKGYVPHLTNFRLGGPHTEALPRLLELCRAEKIPVVLVMSPEGEEFRSWYEPGTYESVHGYIQELATQFGLPVVDAHEWFHEEDFADSHHLLMGGVQKYTARLGQEAILPALQAMGVVKSPSIQAMRELERKKEEYNHE